MLIPLISYQVWIKAQVYKEFKLIQELLKACTLKKSMQLQSYF